MSRDTQRPSYVSPRKTGLGAVPFVRPESLVEVARLSRFDPFFPTVREFLDTFYIERDHHARQAMVDVEPGATGIPQYDAYMAAAAEHLAITFGLQIPSWVNDDARFLRFAYFPSEMESLKATYLKESPPAFRRRLIFVDADPLSRPLRTTHEETHVPTL